MRAPRTPRPAAVRSALLFVLAAVLAGCAGLTPPEPATEQAERVDDLYMLIFGIAIVIFVVVEGLLIWSIVRYRRRDDRLPSQFHGNTLIEIIWTAIPAAIVAVIFVLSLGALNVVEQRTENPETILVDGYQWQWEFTYPRGTEDEGDDAVVQFAGGEPPVMAVPVGEPVRLVLTSRDVIHAWFVPRFLIKRDVVPYPAGEDPNTLEFTVKDVGDYTGQCAEFCGLAHANMNFVVRAMPRDQYDAWLADLVAEQPAEPSPGATVEAPAVAVKLVAERIAFDTDRLEVPAGEAFMLTLDNRDPAIPHNVSIYRGDERVFEGEIFPGVGTRDYIVPALEPGEYRFVCDVHPDTMVGTLVAE